MDDGAEEFERLATAVLKRFLAQNGRSPLPDAEMAGVAARLWSLVAERGLPRPLAAHECGAPGGLAEAECAPLVARALGAVSEPLLADAVRQLVKACLHPEFKTCRDSFREASPDGVCRRQQLARVRGRVSGTHCVDCPYWVELAPGEHAAFLAREWRSAPAGRENGDEFQAHRAVFLPEDFRRLRRWLHARARQA